MDILYLFHHIHHKDGKHEVHHCGNSKVNYKIKHCSCGKHSIDKETAIGHTINEDLKLVEVKVRFFEKCPDGGWHVESGVKETP